MSLFGNKSSPQKEESKESPPRSSGGLFGNLQAQPPATGGGLFGNKQAQSPATGGGLFGNQQAQSPTKTGGGLFGNQQAQPQTGGTGGGFFGNQQAQPPKAASGGGLFGNKQTQSTTTATGGGLFGNQQVQLPTATGGGIFGNKQTQSPPTATGGGLFGNKQTQKSATEGGLLANQKGDSSRKHLMDYGKGTVNFDLEPVKNKDNIYLYSISCSYSSKGKTLEELRAEDYELMKSGVLSEDIQLKLIEKRKKLGLPDPIPSDPQVFKSQMRNFSMKSFFLSNKYSDVTFKVGDESIPAHRNILGTCSQHFDALFSKHESNTTPIVIEIHDAQPEAFKAIIEFLYCGEVNLHEELAADLLIVAPKFDLNDLATGAEDFLNKIINVDNYLRMLETSDRIGSKSLRKKIFSFIIRNMKTISKREDFEELPRPLLMELLENAMIA